MSRNLFAGGRSCLHVDGCWLIRLVNEGWGCCGNFLGQWWSLPYQLTLPFTNDFSVHAMLLGSILPTVELLSKLQLILKPCHHCSINYVYVLFWILIVISTVFTASSLVIASILSNYFLCSSIRSNAFSSNFVCWGLEPLNVILRVAVNFPISC